MEGGMREIRAFLRRAGIDPDQFELVDGQGGPGNKFSPTAMVELLDYVQDQPYAKAFLTALPVKGVAEPPHPIQGCAVDPELPHLGWYESQRGEAVCRDVYRREVHEPQVAAIMLKAADSFIIVDEVAAAVNDRPPPVDFDSLHVV